MGPARRTRSRILAILLGVSLPVASLELGLQFAAWIQTFETARRVRAENPRGLPAVAFVGDSNIYGLYVTKEETLSAATARIAAARGGRGLHCINLGVPSAPSWTVVDQVRRALEYKPAAIVARCGINNYSSAPVEGGFGLLEQLRFVRTLRRMAFNRRYRDARAIALAHGPAGALVEGAAMEDEGGGRKVFLTKSRDADAEPFEVASPRGGFDFEQVRPRLRADLLTMAEMAERAGAPLIFAGYLAGFDAGFRETRDLMKYFDGHRGAAFADCAAALREAAYNTKDGKPADWSLERVYALQSLVMTADRHPTAFGYEVEARVVARALAQRCILEGANLEDPVELLRSAKITIPFLGRLPEQGRVYEYLGEAGDRVVLVLGAAGTSVSNGLELPFDIRPIVNKIGVAAAGSISAVADSGGHATLAVPSAMLHELADAKHVACIVERGERGGAARVLLSRVLPFERDR